VSGVRLEIGEYVFPTSGLLSDVNASLEPSELTRHALPVGMTGSGKTGLATVLLEELQLVGVPTLVIDSGGAMGGLMLRFPDLQPDDFEPWLETHSSHGSGAALCDNAAETAALWRSQLGSDRDRLVRLAETGGTRFFTPGSSVGMPLNLTGLPGLPSSQDDRALHLSAEHYVGALARLGVVDPDPLGSPEHVLLVNLIEHAQKEGRFLDLSALIADVVHPPTRRIGVMSVDTFIDETRRYALAKQINGLLASTTCAPLLEGPGLSLNTLVGTASGRVACTIVSLAHGPGLPGCCEYRYLDGRPPTHRTGQRAGPGKDRRHPVGC